MLTVRSNTQFNLGPVAQLVSASPCHGEGRRFEPGQDRMVVTMSTWVSVGNGTVEEVLRRVAESGVPSDARVVQIETEPANMLARPESLRVSLKFEWMRQE